jgi:hypothetical protein
MSGADISFRHWLSGALRKPGLLERNWPPDFRLCQRLSLKPVSPGSQNAVNTACHYARVKPGGLKRMSRCMSQAGTAFEAEQ